MTQLSFTLNGARYTTSTEEVVKRMSGKQPEAVRSHGVRVAGRLFPVKQVFEATTGIDRADFQSMQARSVLRRLGFEVVRLT